MNEVFSVVELTLETGLFWHELLHLVFAIPFLLLVWQKYKSLRVTFYIVFVTLILDIDHLLDYFIYFGPTFNLVTFLSGDYFHLSRQAYVIFHGWEWLIILIIINISNKRSVKHKSKIFWIVLLSGYIPHLILDSISIKSFWFYSFFVRLYHGFNYIV